MLNHLLDLIKPYLTGSSSEDTAEIDTEALQAEIAKQDALRKANEQLCLQQRAEEKLQLFQKLMAEAVGSLQGGNTLSSSSNLQGITNATGTGNVVASGSGGPTFKSPRPLPQPIPAEQISHFMQMHVIASNYSINHLPPKQREAYVKFRNEWLVSWHNFPAAQKAMYHRAHMAATNEFKKNEQKDYDLQPPRKRGRRQNNHPLHDRNKNQFSESRNFFNM